MPVCLTAHRNRSGKRVYSKREEFNPFVSKSCPFRNHVLSKKDIVAFPKDVTIPLSTNQCKSVTVFTLSIRTPHPLTMLILKFGNVHFITCCCVLFVLRFYCPVNPMWSCRARSVYLTSHLLGRFSPLSGSPVLCTFFRQKQTTALLESAEGRE